MEAAAPPQADADAHRSEVQAVAQNQREDVTARSAQAARTPISRVRSFTLPDSTP